MEKCCLKSKTTQEKVQKRKKERQETRIHVHVCKALGSAAICWTNVFTNPFSNVNNLTLQQYSTSETKENGYFSYIFLKTVFAH